MTPRAQSNLAALAVALLLVGAALGATLAVATGAFAAADRSAASEQTAEAIADGVVREFGVAGRENALSARAVENLSAERLAERVPAARERSVRVTLGGRTLVEGTGDATTERLVAVLAPRETETQVLTNGTASVPGDAARLELRAENATNESAVRVRVDGRTVLTNRSGLNGTYHLALPGEGLHRVNVTPSGNGSLRGIAYEERGAVLAVSTDE